MYDTYSVNQEPPKEAKKYTISPAFEGAILGVFALLLTFITAYFIYHNSMNVLRLEIKDGLLRTVSGIAACIDGDTLETFTKQSDVSRPEYQEMVTLLQKARIGTKHISYLYINRMVDGKVYYIVDPISIDENGKPIYTDAASLEPSIPMTPYDDADDSLITALTENKCVVADETYTDRWGTFYSAYCPIYNSKKELVGTLGADLRINEMMERCYPMEDATKRAFFVSVSLALLLGTFVWFTRRFTFMLNESRQNIYKNFLIAKKFADQTSSSIGKQFQRTASILKFTAQRLGSFSKFEDKKLMVAGLIEEQNKLNNFAEKLLTLGQLKFSKRESDLENFSISKSHEQVVSLLASRGFKSNRMIYDVDKEIPQVVYGAVVSYEELIGHLYEFCLNLFDSSVYSKTLMIEERCRDVILRQTFAISSEGCDEGQKKLVEAFCRNVSEVNWGEQLELSESINIPIVQELLLVLGSEIKAELKDGFFKVSFDFIMLKPDEDEGQEEA